MTDTRLQQMMRESAEQIPTSPAPLAAIRRQTRRRRTTVGAGVVGAVLVASVVAVGLPHVLDDGGPGPASPTRDYSHDEVPVFLPTSAFDVGTDTDSGKTVITGELVATDHDQCLVVGDDGTPVFWPHGYEGLTHDAHGFSLLDERGHVVAEVGDAVRLRGKWLEPADWGSEYDGCIPDDRRVFWVGARPDVVRPAQ